MVEAYLRHLGEGSIVCWTDNIPAAISYEMISCFTTQVKEEPLMSPQPELEFLTFHVAVQIPFHISQASLICKTICTSDPGYMVTDKIQIEPSICDTSLQAHDLAPGT